jgi:hypothetical protein
MMTTLVENIRKIMGWCPGIAPAKCNTIPRVHFVNPSQIPSDGSNVEKFESKNVMFFANTSVFTFFFVISVNLVLTLSWNLDYAVLIPILLIMYSLLYLLVIKMFQASISIDENGVHLKSFELRDVVLNYKDIKSVTTTKLVKPSITLIAIALIILAAFLAHSIISGEWKLIISIAPLLPWYLLVKHKQDREKNNLDTQLYIESRKKKWYELSPFYSVITDRMTASAIQAAIEHYRGET